MNTTTLGDVIKKTMPNADSAIRLARALDVPVEWLITGAAGTASPRLTAADEADWVVVPHYRLSEFTETAKPEPIETVPLRKDWLNRNARTSSNLWLTEMPVSIEGVGEEGDTILCRDADTHYQEGFYLYFFDGMPVIRQVVAPMLGQLADASRQFTRQDEENPALRLVARVLGTIKLRAI